MINFYPTDNNPLGNLTGFNWDYVTYWGDGIPLLFWIFVYPYNKDFASCYQANEYRWKINNSLLNKSTPFYFQYDLTSSENSFLQFPSNDAIDSNVLHNVTKGTNVCGPYNSNHAVIVIDSPWARSCANRVAAPSADKNKNYAVGVSFDMAYRIAKTYDTWAKWWNANLIPSYLKNALTQVKPQGTSMGGIVNLDILMFDPRVNDSYFGSQEQAGLVVPELRGGGAAGAATILGTQCFINKYSSSVNPFGKAFIGASTAIYKDYTVGSYVVDKNLLIDVPWSGALTGVTSYEYTSTLPYPGCTLNCPEELLFQANGKRSFCDGVYYSTNYSWASNYPAPHTFPRTSCIGGSDPSAPCFSLFPANANWIKDIWKSTNFIDGFYFKVNAGDGLTEAQSCGDLYPSYDIGFNPEFPLYSTFKAGTTPYQILPQVGPWQVEYTLDFSRFQIAGGGKLNNASFQPWTP